MSSSLFQPAISSYWHALGQQIGRLPTVCQLGSWLAQAGEGLMFCISVPGLFGPYKSGEVWVLGFVFVPSSWKCCSCHEVLSRTAAPSSLSEDTGSPENHQVLEDTTYGLTEVHLCSLVRGGYTELFMLDVATKCSLKLHHLFQAWSEVI